MADKGTLFTAYKSKISYSERYQDDQGKTYRHVTIPRVEARTIMATKNPPEVAEMLVKFRAGTLLTEKEWMQMGLVMTPGWVHYMTMTDTLGFRRD